MSEYLRTGILHNHYFKIIGNTVLANAHWINEVDNYIDRSVTIYYWRDSEILKTHNTQHIQNEEQLSKKCLFKFIEINNSSFINNPRRKTTSLPYRSRLTVNRDF